MWGTWCTSYLHPPLRAPRLTLGPRDALGAPSNVRRGGDFAKFYPYTRVKIEFPLCNRLILRVLVDVLEGGLGEKRSAMVAFSGWWPSG